MKKQIGVSLIQLIVTIIVIIIIASVAVFSGLGTLTETTLAKKYNEITEIKDKIKEAEVQIEIDPDKYDYEYFFGKTMKQLQELSGTEAYTAKEDIMNFGNRIGLPSVNYTSDDTWYFLTKAESGVLSDATNYREKYSANKKNLGLSNVDGEYMINITTGKIYLIDGVTVALANGESATYYEYKDIIKVYKNVFEN